MNWEKRENELTKRGKLDWERGNWIKKKRENELRKEGNWIEKRGKLNWEKRGNELRIGKRGKWMRKEGNWIDKEGKWIEKGAKMIWEKRETNWEKRENELRKEGKWIEKRGKMNCVEREIELRLFFSDGEFEMRIEPKPWWHKNPGREPKRILPVVRSRISSTENQKGGISGMNSFYKFHLQHGFLVASPIFPYLIRFWVGRDFSELGTGVATPNAMTRDRAKKRTHKRTPPHTHTHTHTHTKTALKQEKMTRTRPNKKKLLYHSTTIKKHKKHTSHSWTSHSYPQPPMASHNRLFSGGYDCTRTHLPKSWFTRNGWKSRAKRAGLHLCCWWLCWWLCWSVEVLIIMLLC
jgi:hypothetical protein